jgi:LysR family transcriptional activator of dmlA
MAANHSTLVRQWALDGHGIIMLSVWDAARELAQGLLVPVLPAYQQQADIWAVSSTRSAHSGKVQVCVDFLREQLQRGPYALQTQLQTSLAAQPAPAVLRGPTLA